MPTAATSIHIDDTRIAAALETGRRHDAARVRAILSKGLELHGLDDSEMAVLTNVSDPELLGELYDAARAVKERIYGNRLVIFAPLYISNMCCNECTYCAFRARNRELKRRALTQEEIAHEVTHLVEEGHKRILMVAGESYPNDGFSYVLRSIETIYATTSGRGEIRRVNVNIAPLTADEFRQLKGAEIGTYQLFQETYHRPTYGRVHLGGKKVDYDWRITAMDRAMEAGIDDVGVGVLFGLADWRFELLALMQHIRHLERTFGVGPHTISVPRLEPASGSDIASHPPQSGVRHRLPQARGHPAPGRAVHRHHHVHPRDGRDAPRDLRPGRVPDLRRQPHQPGRLRRGGAHTTPPSSRSATTARWTRWSATWRRWATCRRSAPPATAWAAPAPTSWTSPSPARSRTTASPTPSPPSRSTWTTSPRPRPARPARR